MEVRGYGHLTQERSFNLVDCVLFSENTGEEPVRMKEGEP